MTFFRRTADARQADSLARALDAADLSPFDAETRRLAAAAGALRPAVHQSEEHRAATKDRMLRFAEASRVHHRDAAETERADREVEGGDPHVATINGGGAVLVDLEPIDADRAQIVAEQLARARQAARHTQQ